MKKIFTFVICAICAMSVNAKVIWSESFNYAVGNLTTKTTQDDLSYTDYIYWYYNTSGSYTLLQVADINLTYPNYCSTATGKAVKIAARGYKTGRQFAKISTGSVFVSALIKINTLQSTDGTKEYFLYMTPDISGSNAFAKLHTKKDADGYYLGIAKSGESNTYLRYSQKLAYGETYLIVMQYDFAEGDKNDFVSLYINPTSKTTQPTITCVRDTTAGGGAAQGSDSKTDATSIAGIVINQSANTSRDMIIDEIKVFTNWSDISLPSGSDDPVEPTPTLSVSKSSIDFGKFIKGGTYEETFTVTASNLKADITISSDNTNAVLVSPASISKDNEDLATGVTITAKINPERQFTFTGVKITVSSEDAESKVITAKGTEQVIKNEEIELFSEFTSETETEDVIFTYTGTTAKISSINEGYKQITLKDVSNKMIMVQIADEDWESLAPVIDMKVNEFVFTATIISLPLKVIATPTALTFKGADFEREVTSLNIGTICLKGIVQTSMLETIDATFYKILYKEGDSDAPTNIVFEEVTELEENMPYIFQPNSIGTMKFYTSNAANDIPGNMNGLYGTFEAIDIEPGLYLISNNMICKAGTGCDLAANRAYIKMDEVPVQAQANKTPGRRTISLTNPDGYAAPTGCQNIKANANYRKAMIDGQIVIMNNGNKKNIFGQTIK